MAEEFNISLNYQGNDITVSVDGEMANDLLNDPVAAEQYVSRLLGNNSESEGEGIEPVEENVAVEETEAGCSSSQITVWISKRPTDVDHEATVAFLNLREKYAEKFNDKRSRKSSLWGIIGNELNSMGFYLGKSKKDIIEKLRQKFANLQKQYLSHIKHLGTTGESRKQAPPYFEEMHSILGLKDKVDPKNLQDSLPENLEQTENEENILTSPSLQNRFSSPSNRPRPLSLNQQIMNELKTQHIENMEEKKRQFHIFETNLQKQTEQRERMLEKFDRFLDLLDGRNRKRRSFSDSE